MYRDFVKEKDEKLKLGLWDLYMAQQKKLKYKSPDVIKNAKKLTEADLLKSVQKDWQDKVQK